MQLIKAIKYRISNKEPQNHEGFTSTFDIPYSIFCGLKKIIKPHTYTALLCQECARVRRWREGEFVLVSKESLSYAARYLLSLNLDIS